MVYKLFDKRISGGAATVANKSVVKNENISNKELAEELHKPVIRNFKKLKVCYVLLILSVKMHGLPFWKIRKAFQLLILFKNFT